MKHAVIKGSRQEGNISIKFVGTYDECIQYMRTHTRWDDLVTLNDDGSPGRMSSWVL